MSAEASLWAAVIAKAYNDACHTETLNKRKESATTPGERDAVEAWAFLTAGGEWKAHREWVSGINGLNSDVVREEAIRRGPSRAVRAALLQREIAATVKAAEREYSTETFTRDRAVIADWTAGMMLDAMAEKYGLCTDYIRKIARVAKAKRPDGFAQKVRAIHDARKNARAKLRRAEMASLIANGASDLDVAAQFRVTAAYVGQIRRKLKAGSAVEDRGISRAAGGVCGSFHAPNVEQPDR